MSDDVETAVSQTTAKNITRMGSIFAFFGVLAVLYAIIVLLQAIPANDAWFIRFSLMPLAYAASFFITANGLFKRQRHGYYFAVLSSVLLFTLLFFVIPPILSIYYLIRLSRPDMKQALLGKS